MNNEGLAESLRLIVRDLNSSESALRVRESQLSNVPKEQRWSAEQSLRQLAENVREVNQEAQALADLIRELLDRNGLLNTMQKAQGIIDLAKDLERTAAHEVQAQIAQTLQAATHATIGPASQGVAPLSVSGIAAVVAFAYVAVKAIQRRLGTQTTSHSDS